MKNTHPNAQVTLRNLDPKYFVQTAEGKISLNPDGSLPDDKVPRYSPGPDPFNGTFELFDVSANRVVWSVPVVNSFSTQGAYLGSAINFGLADLA